MNPGPPDHDALREGFSALRHARQRSAGEFDRAVSAGRERAHVRRTRARRRTLLAAALGVSVVAALSVHLRAELRQRANFALAREAVRIAEWHSPTDVLLAPPYPELLREIPSLPASVLEAPTQSGGGSQ